MNPIFIIIFKIFENNLNSNYFYQEKTDRYGANGNVWPISGYRYTFINHVFDELKKYFSQKIRNN